jgi:hypothetical protein
VLVVETHAMASGFWTRVRPFDGVDPNGWIPASLLSPEPITPGAPLPYAPTATGTGSAPGAPPPGGAPPASGAAPAAKHGPPPPPRWGVRTLVAYDRFGPAVVDEEYSDGGFRADVQYLRYLKQGWFSGFGLGWRIAAGHPKAAYETPSMLDDPRYSLLQMFELGARAGQRYGPGTGTHFDWLIGPTLALVNESATITAYQRVTPDSLVEIGERNDGLTRFAGGGELRLQIGWAAGEGNTWGIHLGMFMYAWEGHEEHSLVTDFVKSNLHGWDIGVDYTFNR